MRVVGLDGVTDDQLPEAMHRHPLPDFVCGLGLAVMNGLQHQILLEMRRS